MINIKIICVGKLKEKYLKEACNEYLKRLSKYCKIEIIEVEDEKFNDSSLSILDIENVKKKECEKIKNRLEKLGKCSVISLDLKGKDIDSVEFSKIIQNNTTYISSTLVFIIGGSLGLTDDILKQSNNIVCFSKLTFPHQLIRIFLLEQIFRSFKILNNEIYHH